MDRDDSTPTPEAPPVTLAQEAVALFQPHYAEPLSEADGAAIARNLGEALAILWEWRQDEPKPDGPTSGQSGTKRRKSGSTP